MRFVEGADGRSVREPASARSAIDEYLEVTQEKSDHALLAEVLASPDFMFRTAPLNSIVIAERTQRYGLLRQKPRFWRD